MKCYDRVSPTKPVEVISFSYAGVICSSLLQFVEGLLVTGERFFMLLDLLLMVFDLSDLVALQFLQLLVLLQIDRIALIFASGRVCLTKNEL